MDSEDSKYPTTFQTKGEMFYRGKWQPCNMSIDVDRDGKVVKIEDRLSCGHRQEDHDYWAKHGAAQSCTASNPDKGEVSEGRHQLTFSEMLSLLEAEFNTPAMRDTAIIGSAYNEITRKPVKASEVLAVLKFALQRYELTGQLVETLRKVEDDHAFKELCKTCQHDVTGVLALVDSLPTTKA